jgi:hypothetical protein
VLRAARSGEGVYVGNRDQHLGLATRQGLGDRELVEVARESSLSDGRQGNPRRSARRLAAGGGLSGGPRAPRSPARYTPGAGRARAARVRLSVMPRPFRGSTHSRLPPGVRSCTARRPRRPPRHNPGTQVAREPYDRECSTRRSLDGDLQRDTQVRPTSPRLHPEDRINHVKVVWSLPTHRAANRAGRGRRIVPCPPEKREAIEQAR